MIMCTLQNLHLSGGDDGDDFEVSLRKTISLNIELMHCFCLLARYIFHDENGRSANCVFTLPISQKSCQQNPYPIYHLFDQVYLRQNEEEEL